MEAEINCGRLRRELCPSVVGSPTFKWNSRYSCFQVFSYTQKRV